MFKILTFLIIAVAWVQSQKHDNSSPPKELIDRLIKAIDDCVAESGAEPDVFDKYVQGTYKSDMSTKKFIYCYLDKGGFIDSEGYFIKQKVLDIVGPYDKPEQLAKQLDHCNEEVRNSNQQDKNEKAFALIQCLHSKTSLKLKFN